MTNLTTDNIAALDKVMKTLDALNTAIHQGKTIAGNEDILYMMETLSVEFQSELIDREQDQEEYIHPDVAAYNHAAFSDWFNGLDFKNYFKLLAVQGTSLVFEASDMQEYNEGAADDYAESSIRSESANR